MHEGTDAPGRWPSSVACAVMPGADTGHRRDGHRVRHIAVRMNDRRYGPRHFLVV